MQAPMLDHLSTLTQFVEMQRTALQRFCSYTAQHIDRNHDFSSLRYIFAYKNRKMALFFNGIGLISDEPDYSTK